MIELQVRRLWDDSSADADAVAALPHYWLYEGTLHAEPRRREHRRPRDVPRRCSLVPQHAITDHDRGVCYVCKCVVESSTRERFVVMLALCSFECAQAFTVEPTHLLTAAVRHYDAFSPSL